MGKMVIATNRTDAEIGKQYSGLMLDGKPYPDQRFVVMGEATFDEWVASSKEHGLEMRSGDYAAKDDPKVRYYLISTD